MSVSTFKDAAFKNLVARTITAPRVYTNDIVWQNHKFHDHTGPTGPDFDGNIDFMRVTVDGGAEGIFMDRDDGDNFVGVSFSDEKETFWRMGYQPASPESVFEIRDTKNDRVVMSCYEQSQSVHFPYSIAHYGFPFYTYNYTPETPILYYDDGLNFETEVEVTPNECIVNQRGFDLYIAGNVDIGDLSSLTNNSYYFTISFPNTITQDLFISMCDGSASIFTTDLINYRVSAKVKRTSDQKCLICLKSINLIQPTNLRVDFIIHIGIAD